MRERYLELEHGYRNNLVSNFSTFIVDLFNRIQVLVACAYFVNVLIGRKQKKKDLVSHDHTHLQVCHSGGTLSEGLTIKSGKLT